MEAVKAPQRRVRDDERFVIGDEDEDDEDGPPAYEDVTGCGGGIGGDTSGGRSESSSINHVTIHNEELTVREAMQHRIQKGETIRSIAARYAMDVSPSLSPS